VRESFSGVDKTGERNLGRRNFLALGFFFKKWTSIVEPIMRLSARKNLEKNRENLKNVHLLYPMSFG
jgi:hypothetical protein